MGFMPYPARSQLSATDLLEDYPNPPPRKRSTNNNQYHCSGLSQSGAVEICHLAELVAMLFFPSFFCPFWSADFTGSSLLVGT
jgi:hypothetical protein